MRTAKLASGWTAFYVKLVDSNEATICCWPEIHDPSARRVALPEKFPVDSITREPLVAGAEQVMPEGKIAPEATQALARIGLADVPAFALTPSELESPQDIFQSSASRLPFPSSLGESQHPLRGFAFHSRRETDFPEPKFIAPRPRRPSFAAIMASSTLRADGRQVDQLRSITFEANVAPHATGSVLVSFGQTRVICAATIEANVPTWMKQQKVPGGWLTAEYSMLPYSTLDRKPREVSKGRQEGRTVEIQRLIGRSLRAVVDLQKLGQHTLWIDCDVLQADGGTRTASITGAYLAARLAVQKLVDAKRIPENPMSDSVAAISVGLFQGRELLDLAYVEDKDAEVDFNIVMTGRGQFVEVQGTGEESTYSHEQLISLIALAQKGIRELSALQSAFLVKQLL